MNLFKSLTILGSETAISGVSYPQIKDSYTSDSNPKKSNDPNLNTSINNIAKLRQLVDTISPNQKKRNNPTKLGTDQNPKEEQ